MRLYGLIASIVRKVTRVSPNILVFTSKPDYSDNARALSDYILSKTSHYDIYWRVGNVHECRKKYPNAKINWKEYEIHHMRPLKYGGTNALSNGIALKKNVHAKFNAWWSNY